MDPTAAIATPNDALDAAEDLLAAPAVHDMGRHMPCRPHYAELLCDTAAAVPLAAMLYAASPAGNDAGIQWVQRAVDDIGTKAIPRRAAGTKPLPSVMKHAATRTSTIQAAIRNIGQRRESLQRSASG